KKGLRVIIISVLLHSAVAKLSKNKLICLPIYFWIKSSKNQNRCPSQPAAPDQPYVNKKNAVASGTDRGRLFMSSQLPHLLKVKLPPLMERTASAVMKTALAEIPDKLALRGPERELTYRQLVE